MNTFVFAKLAATTILIAIASSVVGAPAAAQDTQSAGPLVMRRLTQEQYRNIVQDVFGASMVIKGRFEPDPRAQQLVAVGSSSASITASGMEQYVHIAKGIAAQVVDEQHRDQFLPCRPAAATAPDDHCSAKILAKFGRLLFRRPLQEAELADYVKASNVAAARVGDFYSGLQLSLAALLESPQFLFVHEQMQNDPRRSGSYRLDAWSMASRLSFFLWNTAPDTRLLDAADRGELYTNDGLARQVDRLLTSPRVEVSVRAFFTDMLGFDAFDALDKDGMLYPNFNALVAADAREQTLRTIVDHVLKQQRDYRDLFTTRKTFLTPLLGSLYRVPVATPNGYPQEWVAFEYPQGSAQAGILTHASFLALHSHPGRSSPTLRGKAVREVLLCQKVPDPPANVNFENFEAAQKPGPGQLKTVRDRLHAHASEPMCAGCHKVTDPIGLALENFDTIASFRQTENGSAIDTSGELDGAAFADAATLGKTLRENPQAPACLTKRLFAYATGRVATKSEGEWLKQNLQVQFAADGYKLPGLLRRIAVSPNFYRIDAPEALTAKAD